LSALTGGVRVASCKRSARSPATVKTVPDRRRPLARALQPLAQQGRNRRTAGIVRGPRKHPLRQRGALLRFQPRSAAGSSRR
jgi:hypothetical protein